MRTTLLPTDTDDFTSFQAPHFVAESRGFTPSDTYTADEVAALSTERVVTMTRGELIQVIRSVRGGHLRPGVRERLPQMDAETLRRLVFLTRRFCRNQQRLMEDAAAGIAVPCG